MKFQKNCQAKFRFKNREIQPDRKVENILKTPTFWATKPYKSSTVRTHQKIPGPQHHARNIK
jgi:hypothetical protein